MRTMARHLLLTTFPATVTTTGILLGLAAAGGAVGGCDSATHEADRQVQANVEQAMNATEPERTQKLESAAQLSDASSAAKAQAQSALGQANVDAANDLLDQLGRSQIEAARLMWHVAQVAGQIAHNNTLAQGYRQLDPKAASDEIAKKIAEARGSADAAWFTHDGATIPTLAAVTQEIARLEGEIAKLEEQSRQLSAQRSAALDQAEQASRQAETLQGKPAVDEYKRGSDLRKQAADLSIEIDKVEAALWPLRSQLAVANGQRDILNQVIAQYDQQQKQLNEAWSAMQQQAEAQNAVARQIAGGAPAASGGESESSSSSSSSSATLDQMIAQLDELQRQNQDLRARAQDRLQEAVKAFADAATEASNITGEINQLQRNGAKRDSAQLVALTTLRDVFNPASLLLDQANAQYLLATLHASHAAMLAERSRVNQLVSSALQQASLSVPESVGQTDLEQQITEARALANSAYEEAETLLLDVMKGSATEAQKNAATVARIFDLYGWSQASAAAGDAEAAQQHLAAAVEARRQAEQQQGMILPVLPAALSGSPGAAGGAEGAGGAAAAEAAADEFANALEAGDADKAEALVVSADQAATADTLVAAVGALSTLSEAVEAKFSDAGSQALMVAPNVADYLRDGQVVVQGQTAQLTHANLAQPLALKQVDGAWKLDLSTLDPQQLAALEALAQAAPQLAQDVAAGKYATVNDLRQAILAAVAAQP